jgi:hypothetical protein
MKIILQSKTIFLSAIFFVNFTTVLSQNINSQFENDISCIEAFVVNLANSASPDAQNIDYSLFGDIEYSFENRKTYLSISWTTMDYKDMNVYWLYGVLIFDKKKCCNYLFKVIDFSKRIDPVNIDQITGRLTCLDINDILRTYGSGRPPRKPSKRSN